MSAPRNALGKGDAVVIGASLGGLVAAAYLARAGRKVTVLEAAASPPEPLGTLHALDPQMMTELKLMSRGLGFTARDLPLSLLGDTRLTLSRDKHALRGDLAAVEGADAYLSLRRELFAEARRLRPFWWAGLRDGAPALLLRDQDAVEDFERLCFSGADAWLKARLHAEPLVAALLWDATQGGLAPAEPGSALALLWRAAQEMVGLQGAVALPEPGSLMRAVKAACAAELRCYARVTGIVADKGKVEGVTLEDGEVIAASSVLSSLSRRQTMALAGLPAPPAALVGEARLRLTLGTPLTLAPARYVIAERADLYLDAYEEARAGNIAAELPLEFVAITPTRLAVTLRPVPVAPKGDWRGLVAAQAIRAIARHVPGLESDISHITFDSAAPRASLGQLLAPAGQRINTGLEGLYLCGDDAEPMPSLSGRAGRIAAGFVLK